MGYINWINDLCVDMHILFTIADRYVPAIAIFYWCNFAFFLLKSMSKPISPKIRCYVPTLRAGMIFYFVFSPNCSGAISLLKNPGFYPVCIASLICTSTPSIFVLLISRELLGIFGQMKGHWKGIKQYYTPIMII